MASQLLSLNSTLDAIVPLKIKVNIELLESYEAKTTQRKKFSPFPAHSHFVQY